MYKEALRPVWAEINLTDLEYNIDRILEKIGDSELIGVIKADAYGHGAIKYAQILQKKGCKTFAIATLHEAIQLREAGFKEDIIMLGLVPDMYADTVVKYDIIPAVDDSENVKAFDEEAHRQGKVCKVIIVCDTGMGRIGYQADDIPTAVTDIKKINELPNTKIVGIFSHMSTADAYDKTYSHGQEEKFNKLCAAIEEAGVRLPMKTLANSASIMELPTVHFDACRAGIILYGLYPSNEVDRKQLDLKPVMSVKANIVHLKEVGVGFSVGYGRKFISERPSKIATLALGYADGYPRPYSKFGKVIVNGVVCPIAGNICMDQCMVDVTDVPEVHVGDEVIVMGSDGVNEVSADYIAEMTGTINYEITCAFGQRLPKVYVRK
ncbi:MAG: alanine racemase [Firmicutes bacterium]|nr:alanine racemase [Bacillota bacterium]MBQ6088426.1 alanine racemase [Bacillota bacterium]